LEEKSLRLNSLGEDEFGSGIEEINGILGRLFPPTSSVMQAVDVKGQDYATYYYAAFSGGLDLDSSIAVYDKVKNLVRVIVLMDRYFEVGNQRYRRLGQALLARLKREGDESLKSIIRFNMKQFWPFWKYEDYVKRLMLNGHKFSDAEIRNFNLFKSSDAPLLYAPVLETAVPNYPHSASLIIHYNQALQDIEDDLDDIQEDLEDQMPNIFILSSLGNNPSRSYAGLYKHRMNGSMLTILENSCETVLGLVDEYMTAIEGSRVPNQFKFLKYLSRSYSERIKKKIPVNIRESQRMAAA
jgi:hypothetical protein